MPKYHVITNKRAGTANEVSQAVLEAFAAGEVQVHHVAGDPTPIARQAATDPDCQVLVAAGGDGTVSTVAAVCVAQGKTLGVIPGGTLNHFAQDLGLPQDMSEAAQRVTRGNARQIDYVSANKFAIINNASFGVYPKFVEQREQRQSAIGKWPAAVLSALLMLKRPLRRQTFELTIDGATQRVKSGFVFIGNNAYHTTDSSFGGRTSLTSGKLSIIYHTKRSWIDLAKSLLHVYRGQTHASNAHVVEATSVTIDTRTKTAAFAHDGEVERITTPITFTIKPGGLTVIS